MYILCQFCIQRQTTGVSFHSYFVFIYCIYLCMCVCVYMNAYLCMSTAVYMTRSVCRSTLGSQFSTTTLWDPQVELRSSGLCEGAKPLSLWPHHTYITLSVLMWDTLLKLWNFKICFQQNCVTSQSILLNQNRFLAIRNKRTIWALTNQNGWMHRITWKCFAS